MTSTILTIAQIVVSLLLVGAILLQQRGSGGLSPVFGGDSGAYRTRRGVERSIFIATIVFGALFLVVGLLNIILR